MTEAQPTSPLMDVILSLLAPFLAAGGTTDPDRVRQAATEILTAYNAVSHDQLITATQIVAFALTALDNLRLSLPEALSLPMKLKLRNNANALTRTSQRATVTLETQRQTEPAAEPDPTQVLATLETTKTQLQQPNPQTDHQIDKAWADAMTDVATEYKDELAALPPTQRRIHLARISALSEIAFALGTGTAPPLKSRLPASPARRD